MSRKAHQIHRVESRSITWGQNDKSQAKMSITPLIILPKGNRDERNSRSLLWLNTRVPREALYSETCNLEFRMSPADYNLRVFEHQRQKAQHCQYFALV